MEIEAELASIVNEEHDGTYTAVASMSNFSKMESAEKMCEVMHKAIIGYLSERGIDPVIDNSEIN